MGFPDKFDNISQMESRSAAARRIHDEVDDWHITSREIASRRWIWELLQNAKDCAKGKPFSFSMVIKKDTLTVHHDAGPFQLKDIVALVEGDSSKVRRAEDTTGKFGKGFLVSHVVSRYVQVRGVLADETGQFEFSFPLRRYGSEAEIKGNIERCRDSLADAKPYDGIEAKTEFVYHLTPNEETEACIDVALSNLRNHAPYLFSFMPNLERISVEQAGQPQRVFATTERRQMAAKQLPAKVEKVLVSTPDGILTVLVFTRTYGLKNTESQIALRLDTDDRIIAPVVVAKVFQDLPLYGTADFHIPVVMNLPSICDVNSDRAVPIIAKPETEDSINNCLGLVPSIAEWVMDQRIGRAHLLAEFGVSDEMKKEAKSSALWENSIRATVKVLATIKLVECGARFIKSEDAVFPEATWLPSLPPDNSLLLGVQQLLARRGSDAPNADSVADWDSILAKWHTIPGISVGRRVGLESLFNELQDARSFPGLRNRHSAFENDDAVRAYVCSLFQVGDAYCQRQRIEAPAGLKSARVVPDQNGQFREGHALKLDGGIDPTLKDVSRTLGIDLKRDLIDLQLGRSAGRRLVSQLSGDSVLTVEKAVAKLTSEIDIRYSSDSSNRSESALLENAAAQLLVWFAGSQAHSPNDLSSFPLLCADGKLHVATDYHDTFLLPALLVAEPDRQWLDLFPESVRLSDSYLPICDNLGVPRQLLTSFLEGKSLGSSSLIIRRTLSSGVDHFSAMHKDPADSGHEVQNVIVTDIAGISRLLSETGSASSAKHPEKARRVLAFILSYVAPNDESWRTAISLHCAKSHGCSGSAVLYPCFWLAKIKRIHWVPSSETDSTSAPLSARNVKEIWEHLPSTDSESPESREFLALHFGIDRLEMAIRVSAGDDTERRMALRNELAELVDTGADPTDVREFIERRKKVSEINTRNARLGRIVENLVKEAFDREGFEVVRDPKGCDFKVSPVEVQNLSSDNQEVGELSLVATYQGIPVEFFVEVKATKEDVVRMSWRQAEKATTNLANYVLCVVDFSKHADLYDLVLEQNEPTCEIIAACIGLVPTIGQNLALAVQGLASAVEIEDPSIKVEKADEVRFRISQRLWQNGRKLPEWTKDVREAIRKAEITPSDSSKSRP